MSFNSKSALLPISCLFKSLPHTALISKITLVGPPLLFASIDKRCLSLSSRSPPLPVSKEFMNQSSKMSTAKNIVSKATVKVGCVQLCCNEDKEKNLETARSLIMKAKEDGAKMIFLPEAFDYIGRSKEESAELSETLEGPLIAAYKNLAKELNVWLSLGGFHERQNEIRDSQLPWMTNNHVVIDSVGEIRSVYRKVHLFDVVIPEEKVFLKESSFIKAGNEIVKPISTPIGNLGLGICYDLRFPQFSLTLRDAGADMLTYPSAFTVPTGQAHWEALLRARAIETQCFVVAAAQAGQHNSKRSSYGHSLIIDPWGKVLADAGQNIGYITAEIDLNQIASVRRKMPVIQHCRDELYQHGGSQETFTIPPDNESEDCFPFGHVTAKLNIVFLQSKYARAFVNKKCVVPGHVLISTKRKVKRMTELTSAEVSDMFCLVQKVQLIMEGVHQATSSTIAVQDGKDAGQTIEHVHIHVLPRKKDDLKENDEIYDRLAKHDKGKEIQWREEGDMIKECLSIRQFIRANLQILSQ